MAKVWFRRRVRRYGIGYNVASLEGLIATFAFIALFTATAHLWTAWVADLHWRPLSSGIIVVVPLLAEMGAFLWLVHFKSDRAQS